MTEQEIPTPPLKSDVVQAKRAGVNFPVWIGPIVTFFGAISYFLYFVQFADLRDFPWVNLPLVALGVVCSAVGLWRALFNPGYRFLSKGLASFGLLFSGALAALFVFYIFNISYQMPEIEDVANVADAAPAFSLPDQRGDMVQLSDFQGKNLVIAFYRGHW